MKRDAGTLRLSEQTPELRRVIEALLAQRAKKKAAPADASAGAAKRSEGQSNDRPVAA